MRKVKLIKTNQGVQFRTKDDHKAAVYVRGEFKLKEQGYEAWPIDQPDKKIIFRKDKSVYV